MGKEKEKKKIKVPKSVLDLRLSVKKYAKKHDIDIKGKGLSKKDKKRNEKKLKQEYSESAIEGLNKAVKILAEVDSDSKKINKIKDGVDNIISNPSVMKRIAKIYKDNPEEYPNLIYLPYMIMNTLNYYASEGISDEEKELGEKLDSEALMTFCEKILKKQIKKYKKYGLDDELAFQMAVCIPSTKMFKNNRSWYRRLINQLYDIAKVEEVDVDQILKAVIKLNKDKYIDKKDFMCGFFSEFILTKSTNKTHTFTESQKELHDALIERALVYLDSLKGKKLRDILKQYIKRRKTAEEYKNDTRRVIKFTDHANSNSPYPTIKSVVQELISDNSSNELYLS